MKLALYSAIFGKYEATAKLLPADIGIPAIMYTDNPTIADQAPAAGWRVVFDESVYERFQANPANGDPAITVPMLAHKYWKTHPLEAMKAAGLDVDASIWIDGNMQITSMPGVEWVARNVAALGDDDWSLMAHPWRDCVYTEQAYTAAVCWGRYSVEAMARQIAAIEASGHPRGWGLFATGHMIRRHVDAVVATCNVWWDHNVEYSHQDQLSLPPLVRIATEMRELRWNTNLPWGLWTLHQHGG